MRRLFEKHLFLIIAIIFFIIAVSFGLSAETLAGNKYSRIVRTDWGMIVLSAIFGAGAMYALFKYIGKISPKI
jgi:hypothetical protein